MIAGCMQRLVALVGCLVILVVSGGLAWQFRDGIRELYRSQVEARFRSYGGSNARGAEPAPSVGRPSTRARRSAARKQAQIARQDGPAYVVLTANEMASLIESRLDPAARRALDSVEVSLARDRFTIWAQVRTETFGDVMGPLRGMLATREPLRAAGPAQVQRAGVVAWRPDELSLRAFPFPEAAIPRIVNHLTRGTDGAFHIAVPSTVGDVRVREDGVTFYRWVK